MARVICRADFFQYEGFVEATIVASSAACPAGGRTLNLAHPPDDTLTASTTVTVSFALSPDGQGQLVGGFFSRDVKFSAGLSPFLSVGLDAAISGALPGDQVGELMAECAVDFLRRDGPQFRVDVDTAMLQPRPARSRAHAWVPAHDRVSREGCFAEVGEERAGRLCQTRISYGVHARCRSGWLLRSVTKRKEQGSQASPFLKPSLSRILMPPSS